MASLESKHFVAEIWVAIVPNALQSKMHRLGYCPTDYVISNS